LRNSFLLQVIISTYDFFLLEELIEGQTTQWPKEKGQKGKQQSTKHYTKI
jgi:hypothetical protein